MSNNSNRSSAASYGGEIKCKVALKITKKKDGTPVFYKQDGERFTNQETLKMQTATDYVVKLEITPSIELLTLKFAGVEYPFDALNNAESDAKAVYQLTWSTHGIDPTLSRHRADVPCAIKCKGYKELDFKLQIKFYTTEDSKHAVWGQKLSSLNVDGTIGRGTYLSYVDTIRFV